MWGKAKQFAEGQKLQRLDDLFFTFIAIAKRLRPKVVVAENVKGLVLGNAKGYVHEIAKGFKDAGYDLQLFLLNAASMGVPQLRERTFFIARRKDLSLPPLSLSFKEPQICFGEVRSQYGKQRTHGTRFASLISKRTKDDISIAYICKRLGVRVSGFSNMFNFDDRPAYTITASNCNFRYCDGLGLSDSDVINATTFPQDYKFSDKSASFICGMSVPPVMMAQVASRIAEQWFIGE